LDNNDLLRRLRYALSCDDVATARLINLGGGEADVDAAAAWRAKEADANFRACNSAVVTQFLDGLITDRRGPREITDNEKKGNSGEPGLTPKPKNPSASKTQPQNTAVVDNNVVLKQLRIALTLRSDDVHKILLAGGSALSKTETGALFRKPGSRNYRSCGDQVLKQFIRGLAKAREAHE